MKSERQEVLVLLSEADVEATLGRLRAAFTLTQIASPRLVLLLLRPDQIEQLRGLPGVEMVLEAEPPPEFYEGLRSDESIFARAWAVRARGGAKPRSGEGLPWDAEGYEPPDDPDEGSNSPT